MADRKQDSVRPDPPRTRPTVPPPTPPPKQPDGSLEAFARDFQMMLQIMLADNVADLRTKGHSDEFCAGYALGQSEAIGAFVKVELKRRGFA